MKICRSLICAGSALGLLISNGYCQVESPDSLYNNMIDALNKRDCVAAINYWGKYKDALAEEIKKNPESVKKIDDEISKCGKEPTTRETTRIIANPATGAAGGAATGAGAGGATTANMATVATVAAAVAGRKER